MKIPEKLSDVTCLSDFYYVIGSWFTIICFTMALFILPIALTIKESVVSFLMCGGICFVGAAANYRKEFEHEVHYGAALTSMICSMCWVISVNPIGLLGCLISLIGLIDKKRWLLWMEIACFTSVFIDIFLWSLDL